MSVTHSVVKTRKLLRWIDRHTWRSCTPHQAHVLGCQGIGGIDKVAELLLEREDINHRVASWDQDFCVFLPDMTRLGDGVFRVLR